MSECRFCQQPAAAVKWPICGSCAQGFRSKGDQVCDFCGRAPIKTVWRRSGAGSISCYWCAPVAGLQPQGYEDIREEK